MAGLATLTSLPKPVNTHKTRAYNMQNKSLTLLILLILASPQLAADCMENRIVSLEQAQTQLREILFNQTFKLSQQQREIQNLHGEIELLNYQLELLKLYMQ